MTEIKIGKEKYEYINKVTGRDMGWREGMPDNLCISIRSDFNLSS